MKIVPFTSSPIDNHDRLFLSDGSKWLLTGSGGENNITNELAYVMGIGERPSKILSPDLANWKNSGIKHYAEKFMAVLNALLPVYRQSIDLGGLLVHSGLAEWNGRGVLLAAHSGTGKSTCCRRLPDHWQPLCDDEALVVLDRKNNYRVHPFPTWSEYLWEKSGRTWDVQHSVPLASIFFLEQSTSDGIEPLGQAKAAVRLHASANQICFKFSHILNIEEQKKLRCQLFNNACEMVKKIPAYRLHVSLHGKFWTEIEQVLDQETHSKT